VRDVERYRVPLSEALSRAKIPFHLERAARRPDPAGPRVLSLLECAASGLSARAFADYLAFGVLPRLDAQGRPVASPDAGEAADRETDDDEDADPAPKKRAVIAGALRAPRHWERLLVDAAVVGGGPERWERRLAGLAAELRVIAGEAEDREGPEQKRAEQRLADLERLSAFALPLVTELAALPERASWRELLPRLEHLARSALLDPRRVLEVLAQLGPLVREEERAAEDATLLSLDDVRRVLLPRLYEITTSPPDRGGAVRVLAADAVAGRDFELLLVPGLVERSFPRRILEDPILNGRRARSRSRRARATRSTARTRSPLATLRTIAQTTSACCCAASRSAAPRLVASHPRRDERNRARVPSLYLLELVRADRGRARARAPQLELPRGPRPRPGASGWPCAAAAPSARSICREADLATIAALLASAWRRARAYARPRALPRRGHAGPATRAASRDTTRTARSGVSQDGLLTKDPAVLALLAKERPARARLLRDRARVVRRVPVPLLPAHHRAAQGARDASSRSRPSTR
jgi:ATP-dependent helicase/nuclease subunit B